MHKSQAKTPGRGQPGSTIIILKKLEDSTTTTNKSSIESTKETQKVHPSGKQHNTCKNKTNQQSQKAKQN